MKRLKRNILVLMELNSHSSEVFSLNPHGEAAIYFTQICTVTCKCTAADGWNDEHKNVKGSGLCAGELPVHELAGKMTCTVEVKPLKLGSKVVLFLIEKNHKLMLCALI